MHGPGPPVTLLRDGSGSHPVGRSSARGARPCPSTRTLLSQWSGTSVPTSTVEPPSPWSGTIAVTPTLGPADTRRASRRWRDGAKIAREAFRGCRERRKPPAERPSGVGAAEAAPPAGRPSCARGATRGRRGRREPPAEATGGGETAGRRPWDDPRGRLPARGASRGLRGGRGRRPCRALPPPRAAALRTFVASGRSLYGPPFARRFAVWAPLTSGRSLHGIPCSERPDAASAHTANGRMHRAAGRRAANPRPAPLAPPLSPYLNTSEGDFRGRSLRKSALGRVQVGEIRPQPRSGTEKVAPDRVQVPGTVSEPSSGRRRDGARGDVGAGVEQGAGNGAPSHGALLAWRPVAWPVPGPDAASDRIRRAPGRALPSRTAAPPGVLPSGRTARPPGGRGAPAPAAARRWRPCR